MKGYRMLLVIILGLVFSCSSPKGGVQSNTGIGHDFGSIAFKDIDGGLLNRQFLRNYKAVVLFFLDTECPVCTKYMDRVKQISTDFRTKQVTSIALFPNPSDDAKTVKSFLQKHGLSMPAVLDHEKDRSMLYNVKMVPCALVFDSNFVMRYRGRIDDNQYESDVRKKFLTEALEAVLEGKNVAVPETEQYGCVVSWGTRLTSSDVTYTRDVAPILFKNCVSCHRDGEAAPFSLTSYEDAKRWAPMIKYTAQKKIMPPWKAINPHGFFRNDRRMTYEEINTLVKWVDSGKHKGEPRDTPELPPVQTGWKLGEPDQILEAPVEFKLEATGKDVYRAYLVGKPFEDGKWINGMEVRPGNRRVVHHVLVYVDTSGRAKELDDEDPEPGYTTYGTGPGFLPAVTLGGFAPGTKYYRLPEEWGYWIPKGGQIVIEVHYNKSGKPETDRTSIGLYFSKKTVKKMVKISPIINLGFAIPPGESNYKVEATRKINSDITLLAIFPHMHLLAKEARLDATSGKGENKNLIEIKEWDFYWQEPYLLSEPIRFEPGTRFIYTAIYDNSTNNARNPHSSPKTVRFGGQTTDEMCLCYIAYILNDEDLTKEEE